MLLTVSSSVTRPANTTAYAAGDAVGTALSWGVPDRNVVIVGARITSSGTVATSLDAELLLFHSAVSASVDNVAVVMSDAEALTRVGSMDFPTASWRLYTSNSGCEARYLAGRVYIPFQVRDGTLYGQLVARNAYVPESAEVFTVQLMVEMH